ncbi:MAG TPA: hypothetical protein VNU64_20255 [Burkholderiales bacterium]|nr:hypothetical protein [Burkholderiales bacterium]
MQEGEHLRALEVLAADDRIHGVAADEVHAFGERVHRNQRELVAEDGGDGAESLAAFGNQHALALRPARGRARLSLIEDEVQHFLEHGLRRERARREPQREVVWMYAERLGELLPRSLDGQRALEQPRRCLCVKLVVPHGAQ